MQPLGRNAVRPRTYGSLRFEPSALRFEQEPDKRPRKTKREARLEVGGAAVAWTVAAVALVMVAIMAYRVTRVDLTQDDLADGAALNSLELAELQVRIELSSSDAAESAVLAFEGEEIEEPTIEDDTIVWEPPEGLEEGEYELALTVPRMLLSPAVFTWAFEVDDTPPSIEVPGVWEPVALDEAVVVTGSIEEGADLEAAAGDVVVDDDGAFTLEFSRPPAGPVSLQAVDRAGNRTETEVIIPVEYPATRSVFVTAAAWGSSETRQAVLRLADDGHIDAVHLELKDESGRVGFDTSVDRALEIGALNVQYNLDQAVEALHDRGIRVVGRISAFRDPILAGHAWQAGERDQVVQTGDGQPFGSAPELPNFAHPDVQEYNLDLALDALGEGVDEIVWDHVRGLAQGGAVVPGHDGPQSDALAGFLARSHSELRRRGAIQGMTTLGLSLYGEDTMGQDVQAVTPHVDYVVPVIEPVYWGSGHLGVASPSGQPGEFVKAYLEDFQELTEPTGTPVVPSLQASGGYGDEQIRSQVAAARAVTGDHFLVHSANSSYSPAALG